VTKTPNLDKRSEVSKESQSIGEFLDWLREEKRITLCVYHEQSTEDLWRCAHCGEEWYGRHTFGKEVQAHRIAIGYGYEYTHKKCNAEIQKADDTPSGYYPAQVSFEKLLAEYFEVDLDACEREMRALLDELRRQQKGTVP
jgi:hypothetical protein